MRNYRSSGSSFDWNILSCGRAGLGLEHGASVWIADDAQSFAAGVARLVESPSERNRLARAAREIAERDFDWNQLGEKQRRLYRELQQGIAIPILPKENGSSR